MKKSMLMMSLITALFYNQAHACKPVHPKYLNNTPAFMILSSNSQSMIKIVQERFAPNQRGDWMLSRSSRIESYQLNNDGQLKFNWAIKGLYPVHFPGEFLLSDDGIYLVRIKGAIDIEDKNALTIYKKGKVLKQYAPKDFMPTLKKIQRNSCGFGSWLHYNTKTMLSGTYLSLQTIDGKKWGFDILQPPKLSH